jgi:hypothetical protein
MLNINVKSTDIIYYYYRVMVYTTGGRVITQESIITLLLILDIYVCVFLCGKQTPTIDTGTAISHELSTINFSYNTICSNNFIMVV